MEHSVQGVEHTQKPYIHCPLAKPLSLLGFRVSKTLVNTGLSSGITCSQAPTGAIRDIRTSVWGSGEKIWNSGKASKTGAVLGARGKRETHALKQHITPMQVAKKVQETISSGTSRQPLTNFTVPRVVPGQRNICKALSSGNHYPVFARSLL